MEVIVMKYLLCYLFVLNFIGIIVYGIDKFKASKALTRTRESILLFIGFLGGCLGSLIGMIIFKHKTKKKKFWFLNLLFILMWCYIIYMFYRNG